MQDVVSTAPSSSKVVPKNQQGNPPVAAVNEPLMHSQQELKQSVLNLGGGGSKPDEEIVIIIDDDDEEIKTLSKGVQGPPGSKNDEDVIVIDSEDDLTTSSTKTTSVKGDDVSEHATSSDRGFKRPQRYSYQ